MKKTYILTISLLFILSSNITNTQCEPQDNNNPNSSIIGQESNSDQNTTIKYEDLDDKFDSFVIDAENNGLDVKPMEKPTYLMNMVQKVGIFFFLNPYIFVINKYRITKDFVIKYATITWETIVGKKPEEVTNGTVKE
ncbi:MAG: hypothetical protein UR12_C0038G0007 [candidate division TM6 bacterium GW2011_GWF2_30_66]|jgi:hypothetical protein|nr:MAG: hypothetical protein UR12_C0038G0007 [candidate division TM6 bacterium GW2011_GWF2_30_66]